MQTGCSIGRVLCSRASLSGIASGLGIVGAARSTERRFSMAVDERTPATGSPGVGQQRTERFTAKLLARIVCGQIDPPRAVGRGVHTLYRIDRSMWSLPIRCSGSPTAILVLIAVDVVSL